MLDAAATPALDVHNRSDHHRCCGIRQGWIVATTHPQAERWAQTNLRQNGYRTFLPLIAARRRDRAIPSLFHRVQVPAYPGYLFVWHSSADPRRPIRETPGVRDVVRCGSVTQWCPDGTVEALQSALQADATLSAPSPLWKPGAACSIASGAFYGLPAVVTSITDQTATIAIMMLGQLRQVTVDTDSLAPRDN